MYIYFTLYYLQGEVKMHQYTAFIWFYSNIMHMQILIHEYNLADNWFDFYNFWHGTHEMLSANLMKNVHNSYMVTYRTVTLMCGQVNT